MMDIFIISLGAILVILGIIGSVLPIIPGPPVAFVGMLIANFSSEQPFSVEMLILFGGLAVTSSIIDNVLPIYATKKFNGSKKGVWGSAIGLIIGLFFSPIGIILGPIVGAYLGEIIDGKSSNYAVRPAIGSFIGFISSIFLRLSLSLAIGYFYFTQAIL